MCHCDVAAGEQVDGFCAAKGADGVVLGDGTGCGKADVAGSAGRCAAKGDVRAGFDKDVAGCARVASVCRRCYAAAGDKDQVGAAGQTGLAKGGKGWGTDGDAVGLNFNSLNCQTKGGHSDVIAFGDEGAGA